MNGNAIMYDVGKILTLGSATAYQDASSVVNTQATQRAYTLTSLAALASRHPSPA
jgi:galactose oxidase